MASNAYPLASNNIDKMNDTKRKDGGNEQTKKGEKAKDTQNQPTANSIATKSGEDSKAEGKDDVESATEKKVADDTEKEDVDEDEGNDQEDEKNGFERYGDHDYGFDENEDDDYEQFVLEQGMKAWDHDDMEMARNFLAGDY